MNAKRIIHHFHCRVCPISFPVGHFLGIRLEININTRLLNVGRFLVDIISVGLVHGEKSTRLSSA